MATCTLTAGMPLKCLDSIGGLKNVYISAFSDTTTFTVAADIITASANTGTFYTYKFRPQTASLTEEGSHSLENATNFWTQTLAMIFHKMETEKKINIMTLAGTQMHVIVEDQNGTYWLMGKENGVYLTASSSLSGTAYGDHNGYTISLQGLEPKMATELDSTTFGLLTISA